ncbi:hypothetical protein K458DRAFT_446700 [Lentithecium fluviatile CBS 122367]|uniref:Amino acid transporter n=1 Tax=Lentithecium fluviatile CBS 122367 TaxID=1168545 RepID=A0A6G1IIQ9_9PLEO|nr:hypothetical protein K458DRAFT_446700 [Lentithecium fluviatile CBS 122367]
MTTTRLTADEFRERDLSNTGADGRLKDDSFHLDARTVAILSKRHQISKNFGFTSMLSFSTTSCGLINGGPSALVYGLIFSLHGSLATAAFMAEMASISPTSGGQYHWVALLAPSRYAILLSWLAGCITAFMRIAVTASIAFLAATMIQGLIINYADSYESEQWHGILMYWDVTLTLALILHVIFFFCILVPLVHLAPRSSADFVFNAFSNTGGWKNDAVSTMIWSMVVSGTLCLGMSIAILFTIGDMEDAMNTAMGFPIIEIFFNATKLYAATNTMASALIISIFFSGLGLFTSESRLIWAFARDDGLPFPRYFSHRPHHDPRIDKPRSTTAFNAMVSLALLGQYTSYILPTIFILSRRVRHAKNIPYDSWALGKWGIPVNVFTIAFSFLTIGFNVLPPYFPVTATNMN